MRKRTFTTTLRNGTTRIVTGWQLQCGMVVHLTLTRDGGLACYDHWTVSDPMTGGLIVSWYDMGGALRAYRFLVKSYGARYPEKLAQVRQAYRRRPAPELARQK